MRGQWFNAGCSHITYWHQNKNGASRPKALSLNLVLWFKKKTSLGFYKVIVTDHHTKKHHQQASSPRTLHVERSTSMELLSKLLGTGRVTILADRDSGRKLHGWMILSIPARSAWSAIYTRRPSGIGSSLGLDPEFVL